MYFSVVILESVLLAATLSLDAFIASFAYGSNKIYIPLTSIFTISLICSGMLGISLFFGSIIRPYIPESISSLICFSILFIIGFIKLLDNITKTLIRKYSHISKSLKFSMLNFRFVLKVYADPEQADADSSKSISMAEAASLATALSLDGISVGFGAALGAVNVWAVFLAAILTDATAVLLGSHLGNKLALRTAYDFSWISGAVLIIMAFTKLMW